jgi:hypothetical protein
MSVEDTLKVTNRGLVVPGMVAGALVAAIWYAASLHAQVQRLQEEVTQLRIDYRGRQNDDATIVSRLQRVEILLEAIATRLPRDEGARIGGPR